MDIYNDIVKSVATLEKEIFQDYWDEDSIESMMKQCCNHILVLIKKDSDNLQDSITDDDSVLIEVGEGKIITLANCDGKLECEQTDLQPEKVIGYILYNTVAGVTEIFKIAVGEDYRNCGYASRMLKQYIKTVSAENEKSFLEVRQGNTAAKSLYEKFGYKKIAVRKNYYKNPLENAFIYQLDLP